MDSPDQDSKSTVIRADDELPSCSKTTEEQKEKQDDEDLANIVTAEEYLMRKDVVLLDYERQMFLDMVNADALMVCAK